jgi:hypothetical protein
VWGDRFQQLKEAVEVTHKCKASFVEHVPVVETFGRKAFGRAWSRRFKSAGTRLRDDVRRGDIIAAAKRSS